MENIIKAKVLGARRGNVDGTKYASIYIIEDVVNEADRKGALPMKLNCDYGVVDHLEAEKLPAEMEMQIRLDMAGGGKAAMFCQAVRPINGKATGPAHSVKPGEPK